MCLHVGESNVSLCDVRALSIVSSPTFNLPKIRHFLVLFSVNDIIPCMFQHKTVNTNPYMHTKGTEM